MALTPFAWGLLLVWAMLLLASYLPERLGVTPGRLRTFRLLSSVALASAAVIWAIAARPTLVRDYAVLIQFGMVFGLLGDIIMAGVFPTPNRLIMGMAGFGIGHILYIAAGLSAAGSLALGSPGLRLAAWLAWLIVAAAAWYALIYRAPARNAMHYVALLYALLLASTAGVATGLALVEPRFWALAAGAALFLFSDFLIVLREFRGLEHALIVHGVWATYGPAQALIVYTTALLLSRV